MTVEVIYVKFKDTVTQILEFSNISFKTMHRLHVSHFENLSNEIFSIK